MAGGAVGPAAADLLHRAGRRGRRSRWSRACPTLRPSWRSICKTIPVARRVKAGSSLKFCWVAEGKADIYPRLGPTMEWDVAAGDCVYRQSGRDGERPSPLTYNKPDLRNPSFVIGL